MRIFVRAWRSVVLVPVMVAVFVGSLAAGDVPGAVRIQAAGGQFAAGVQLAPGVDGAFELFAGSVDGRAVHPLGRYNGRIVGLAVNAEGQPLALTRDGALILCSDDPQTLALPGSRWHMEALVLWRDVPTAVSYDNGYLVMVTAGVDQTWTPQPRPVAQTDLPARTVLVATADSLHLFWTTRTDGLAGGGIRHAVSRTGDVWEELPPLMVGSPVGFTVFPDAEGLFLAALIADPLEAAPEHVVAKTYRDGQWVDARLPGVVGTALTDKPFSFAGAAAGQGSLWLASGTAGAVLTRVDASGGVEQNTLAPPPKGFDATISPRFTSFITFGLLCLLFLLYCRRSRQLSRRHPERAPDLLSRGAALGIDWMIASIAMGAYHWANGDVRIVTDMLRLGLVNGIFWANLAGLAFFMLVGEAVFGRTPGKYLAGLHVVSIFGGRPSLFQVVMRNALRAVDMYPLSGTFPGLIGGLATFMNRGRQRIGDMLAGTAVRRHLPLRERGFLLASRSPRRLELLQELDAPVRVEVPDVDEDAYIGHSPEETVRLLAEAKAKAMLSAARPPELLVAADTIVVLDGEILGKPADAADAVSMLGRLSGRSHSVFTGVTVWDPASGRGVTDVEETEVEFRTLSEHEIALYVATGDPLDKAGAYGIQTGHLVSQVRGSLSNVAGLPMEKVQSMIAMLGI